MGDIDVHGSPGGNGLKVLGTHNTTHAGSTAGVLDAGHYVGKGDQVFTGRSADHAFDLLIL